MSDSNRLAMLYIQETLFGTTPATPNMTFLRFTDESLGQVTQTVLSQEIRNDRRIADLIRVGLSGAGSIGFELSAGAFEDFILAALLDTAWSAPVSSSGATITFAKAAGTITRAAGSFVTDGILANRWIRLSKVGGPNDGRLVKVISVSATVITVAANVLNSDETSVTGYTIVMGASAVDGTTFRSFAIEKRYTDLSNEFAIFNGMAIDKMSLSVALNSVIKGSFDFLGKKEASAAATAASSTTAAATNDVLNVIDDVQLHYENGAQYDITDFQLSLQNNLRARLQVGALGAVSVGTGSVQVSGSHKAYYNTKAVMDRYLNASATSLALVFAEAGTSPINGLVIDLPRVKYSSGKRVAGGINQDILADMAFTAVFDPTAACTIRITKW